jgi:hypothetical protein
MPSWARDSAPTIGENRMFTTRMLLAVLAGGLGVSAAHAGPITLNVRPGLWEMTVSGQSSGMPPIPAEVLARMTPEQRAKFQAAIAARMAGGDKPHVYKSCITQTTLQRGFDTGESSAQRKCTQTVLSSSASAMDGREECTGGRARVSGHFHFTAPDPMTVNGAIELAINNGSHTMTMKQVIHAKWVGTDCGQYAHNNNN